MKKWIFVLCLVLGLSTICFASTENVTVLMNRKVQVQYNGEVQAFQNVNGVAVYPLSYEGTTYLPIRAISSLFNTSIRWDGTENAIYLGEGDLDTTSAYTVDAFVPGENMEISVLRNEDVSIVYFGETQSFYDVNGKQVYPLSYEGTTYLPVRAVSNLFGLHIDWDGENNAVIITAVDDTPIDIELSEGEEALVLDNEVHSYFDENGREIFFYFVDNGNSSLDTYYFYFDEEDRFISYYYNQDGEMIFLNSQD